MDKEHFDKLRFSCFSCIHNLSILFCGCLRAPIQNVEGNSNLIDDCPEIIKTCNETNAPLFTLKHLVTAAKIHHVYDGDSFWMSCMFHGAPTTFKCRLQGIDTPELNSHNETEKKLALLAKGRVIDLVNNKIVHVTCGEFDKYGRVLVDITLPNGKNLTQLLIDEKLGFAYDGSTKRTDWDDLLLG